MTTVPHTWLDGQRFWLVLWRDLVQNREWYRLHTLKIILYILSPSRQRPGQFPTLGHDRFLSHPFQVIIYHHSVIRWYTVRVTDSIVKQTTKIRGEGASISTDQYDRAVLSFAYVRCDRALSESSPAAELAIHFTDSVWVMNASRCFWTHRSQIRRISSFLTGGSWGCNTAVCATTSMLPIN